MQGVVTPDEWTVFKPTLQQGARPIIGRRLGTKEVRLVYARWQPRHTAAKPRRVRSARPLLSLSDDEVLKLARWACIIEDALFAPCRSPAAHGHRVGEGRHHGRALSSLQARPETVHSAKQRDGGC